VTCAKQQHFGVFSNPNQYQVLILESIGKLEQLQFDHLNRRRDEAEADKDPEEKYQINNRRFMVQV
jgi:hypothetical protein